MNRQLRVFLGLEPTKPTGRWFSGVLLIGMGAVVYSAINDWSALRPWQRVAAIVKLVIIIVFGVVIILANEWERRARPTEPSA